MKSRRLWRWVVASVSLSVLLISSTALSQMAPTGADHTSVGPGAGHVSPVSPTGGYSAAVALSLPPPRGNLPLPLSIQYTGTAQAGAAGIGWDVPLSYVRRSVSTWHRKPATVSAGLVVPERLILSLGGGQQLMVPAAEPGVWLPFLGDEYMELRSGTDDSWTLSTGSGNDFRFEPAGDDLWLLAEVRDRVGTDRVELEYSYSTCGTGDPAPELASLRYTFDDEGVPLYEVRLRYQAGVTATDPMGVVDWPVCNGEVLSDGGGPSAAPGAAWVFGQVDLEGTLLARSRVLTRVEVDARNNLAPSAAARTIRSYQLSYANDADTGAPRLAAVDVTGEEGSSPLTLPVARYQYGSVAAPNVSFSVAQVVALDPAAVNAGATTLAGSRHQRFIDSSIPGGADVDVVSSRHTIRDFTGDLIPDLVFKDGATWHLRRGVLTDAGFSLEAGVATSWTTPDEIHVQRTERGILTAWEPVRQLMVTTSTEVTFVDWNGDHRLDIVDARTGDPNRWDVWLNLPSPDGTLQWSQREVIVADLVDHIETHGLGVWNNELTPIERSRTWPKFAWFTCQDQHEQLTDPPHFTSVDCEGVVSFTESRIADTVGEWGLLDHNGDSYPDLVANTQPVLERECSLDGPGCVGAPNLPRCNDPDTGWTYSHDEWGNPIARDRRCAELEKQWLTISDDNRVAVLVNRAGGLVNVVDNHIETLLDVGQHGIFRFSNGDGWDGPYTGTDVYDDTAVRRSTRRGGFSDPFGLGRPLYGDGATFESDQDEVCKDGDDATPFTSTQVSGHVDLNGDGIPDSVFRKDGAWKVRFGTTAGFGPSHPITSALAFAISENQGTCGGTSSTVAGLLDLDGDGRPELVRFIGDVLVAAKIFTDDGGSGIAAGRLIAIENGQGATTEITYANNKTDTTTPHDVPVPEVVVASTRVRVDDGSAVDSAPIRFAYGTPEMRYSPAFNRLQFAGFQRHVTLVGAPARCESAEENCLLEGYAVVVDRIPQAAPGAGLDALALGGRVAETTRLEGLFLPDARPILDLDVYAGYRRAQGGHDYEVTELDVAPWSSGDTGRLECIDVDPHTGVPPDPFDLVCHRAAIVHTVATSAWEGLESPDQGSDNVYVGMAVLETDARGRATEVVDYGDLRTLADDRCTTIQYAAPEAGSSPVTSVVSGVWVTDCGWSRTKGGVGGFSPGEPLLLSGQRFLYDGLGEGRVGRGRPTSTIVELYDTSTGDPLGEYVGTTLTYDALGAVRTAVASRSLGTPATRASTFLYDDFGASLRTVIEEASDVPHAFVQEMSSSTWPSVPHEVRGLNGERTITTRDGFGRATEIRTVAPGVDHLLARTVYDDAGREVTNITYPATASLPQIAHVHLDALGRPRFQQVELGSDYGNSTLITGLVEYDSLGRAIYQADPFEWPTLPFTPDDLPEERKSWPYGTTLVHDALGRVTRTIAAPGQRPEETISDVAANVFVSDARYTWADEHAIFESRGPSENEIGSPTSGAKNQVRTTGMGWAIEEARYALDGTRLDLVRRSFDRLGLESALLRYRDPQAATGEVTWTRRRDSRGLILELGEPGTSPALSHHDEWGELIESEWMDGSTRRRTRYTYDGLGRATSVHVLKTTSNGVDKTEFGEEYLYDVHSGSALQPPSSLFGRLSRIQNKDAGATYFAYDPLGQPTSEVSLLTAHGSPMATSRAYHPGGALRELRFDTTAGTDRIEYSLDSAGRIRRITDLGAGVDLFGKAQLDAEGHYTSFRLGNGVTEEFKYAAEGQEDLQIWSLKTASGIHQHELLERDPEGRLLAERYNQQGFTFDVTHEYDALDRLVRSAALTSTPLASEDERFSYDHLGNFKTKRNLFNNGLDRDYKAHPTDPDRVCRFDPAGQTGNGCTFQYDGAGNVINDTWSGTRSFEYDSSSRILAITKGAWRADFLYGPGGSLARTELRQNGHLDLRVWRFGALIEERTRPDGRTQVERRVPGPLGPVATLRTEGGTRETVYVHGDGRGNRFFTRQDGSLSQQVRYRAFGDIVADTGQAASITYTDDLWNGGDELGALGVVRLGARVYDPMLGRFLQRDPITLSGTATRGNPYSFSYNDPTNYSDPTGLCAEWGCPDAFDWAPGILGMPSAVADLWRRIEAPNKFAADFEYRPPGPPPSPVELLIVGAGTSVVDGAKELALQMWDVDRGLVMWFGHETGRYDYQPDFNSQLAEDYENGASKSDLFFGSLPGVGAVRAGGGFLEGLWEGDFYKMGYNAPGTYFGVRGSWSIASRLTGFFPTSPGFGGGLGGFFVPTGARFPKHHTIPTEVLKMLPADVAKQVRGRPGAPNRWRIPLDLHKKIHQGKGGGPYNEMFKLRLRLLGREPTASDVFQIRDDLVRSFGLEQYRP